MSANLRQFVKSVYGFDHVIRSVKPEQWSATSPCEGWTAADVATHAAGVLNMVQTTASGTPAAPASDDIHAAWAQARDGVISALDQPGVLKKVVASPFGEMPVDNLIGILFADTLTHTWDLARAVGGDEALDPDLVAAADATLRPVVDGFRGPTTFGPAVAASDSDTPQQRFLKVLGRKP